MRVEIEKFFESAPTHFDYAARYRSGQSEVLLDLPFSLEDLVLECAERSLAVTWHTESERKDLLKVHQPGEPYSFIYHPTIIDNGDEGIKISESDVSKLHRLLTGQYKEPNVVDFQQVYDREAERLKGLLVVSLNPDVGFGEFIEEYPSHERHTLIDGYNDEPFAVDFDGVALDPRFYGQLDRFLKRRGLLEEHQMISPVALFSQITGNIMLEVEGADLYWNTFIELKKDKSDTQVIGFMTRRREAVAND